MAAPNKDRPGLGSKQTSGVSVAKPQSTPRASDAGLRKSSSTAIRPSITPSQSSSNVAKRKPPKLPSRQASEISQGSGKTRTTTVLRRPSNLSGRTGSTDQSRKPPKLPARSSSGLPSNAAQARKPSLTTRKPSDLGTAQTKPEVKRKPPKLPPKQTEKKPVAGPSERKDLQAPKETAVQTAGKNEAAHKVKEEQQDLKSILSDSQCEDLISLTAGITNRMRRAIEDNFNATATLNKIGDQDGAKDQFASLDFDPGTVDVAAYDKEKKLRDERQKELSRPKVKELKTASLKWFDEWQREFLKRIDETVNPGKIMALQRARDERQDKSSLAKSRPVQTISSITEDEQAISPKLEQLFPRVPTALTKMPLARRALVLHSFLLLLLSLEHYNAASRVFLLYLASSLKLGLKSLRDDEEKTAKGLLEAAKQISASKDTLAKGKESEESRIWKMRLATVAGAAIVGLSGGYAAPMIAASVGAMMSELGLGTSAAAGYLGAVASNTYVVGSLFGAYGGRMTGDMMRNLSADVQDFAFLPVHGERKEHEDSINAVTDTRRLRVTIAISGWLLEKEEVVTPWRVLKPSAEAFALRFELQTLMSFGQSINTMSANDAYGFAQSAFSQRAMVTDLTSAIWPIALVKIARVVENPFSLAKARADKAGKVLAEALISHSQGERPVTLIGYSTGARVIWSCLTSLAERRAFGLVESVVMLGAPVPSDISTWRSMRTAVGGRLINVYSKNDYLLAFLHRTSSLQYGVAGLMPISGLSGVENYDVSEIVSGHLRYRYLIGSILQRIGFEDIDKDEVTKEVDAFKKMAEVEDKHDYVEEVTKSAGEIYKKYAKSGKQPPNKKISDKEADRQISAMEKEVQQNTQQGLMQWAVEQLYLSRPAMPSTEDITKAKSDPQAATKDVTKSANKTADAATKSMYQRAKEAVYISRSGGAEGEDTAKAKVAQAQGTVASNAPNSYLATAAGYIPTSYIPGFGASGSGAQDEAKKLGQASEKTGVTRPGKEQDKAKGAVTGSKKAKKSQKSVGDQAKPTVAKEKSIIEQGDKGKETESPTEASLSTTSTQGTTIYTPGDSATDDNPENSTGDKEETDKSAQSDESASNKYQEKANETASATGYSSYIPSFGFGSSSSKDPKSAQEGPPEASDNSESATDSFKTANEEELMSEDTTPTKASAQKSLDRPGEKTAGYRSYIPSFGFGRSAALSSPNTSAKTSSDKPDEADEGKKQESSDASKEATPEHKSVTEGSDTETDEQKPPLEDPFVD